MADITENALRRIEDEVQSKWFFSEPALHTMVCTHEFVPNADIQVPFRCGRGRIEFNPSLVLGESKQRLEEYLRAEVIRIMLKHPYERQPDASPRIRLKASNMVLTQHYNFRNIKLDSPSDDRLPYDKYFEWYAKRLKAAEQENKMNAPGAPGGGEGNGSGEGEDPKTNKTADNSTPSDAEHDGHKRPSPAGRNGGAGGGTGSGDAPAGDGGAEAAPRGAGGGSGSAAGGMADGANPDSSRWSEKESHDGSGSSGETDRQDEMAADGEAGAPPSPLSAADCQAELWEEDQLRQCAINEKIEAIREWGSVPGSLVEAIISSTRPKLDYRKVLSGFRASVISSRRSLTRMKPNRRTDFQNMGSIYRLRSSILVAVDTSGSVSSSCLSLFLGTVNKFFRYGVESVDLIMFDSQVRGEPVPLKRARPSLRMSGRGGTDYQPVFDFMRDGKSYDGLIVLTDGYAPPPVAHGRRPKVVWVLTSKADYDDNAEALSPLGRCCYLEE